jgi:hypothetical protein
VGPRELLSATDKDLETLTHPHGSEIFFDFFVGSERYVDKPVDNLFRLQVGTTPYYR